MTVVTRKRRRGTTTRLQDPSPSPLAVALPEDLMIEILSRAPVSDPLQLRCVCKWWKSLVSDPQFVKNHLSRSIAEINDLASKALEDMIAFELQLNHAPPPPEPDPEEEDGAAAEEEAEEDAAEEEVRAMRKELDNMLTLVRSLKQSLETIKVDVQEIMSRMRCLQSFLQIYLKTATQSQ
ncbi:hypothetical protein HN51_003719 [Arachis hypogaea]|uniref:F-box domain-containing protein n=2 Tax=Arachis TaxID=3817 RepID=A0A445DJW0_ARAHY|nr:uncharacterized protein LOC107482668 [Arachis duranensis]XP_057754584.1 uncharacterized protein LOC130973910 [Arachis stenosperma]QHO37243.1 Putative F-box protein [Arachis hypogaea]RYR63491.1 hypothetical protein Ahy_A04g021306 [Arachis hypogaea]